MLWALCVWGCCPGTGLSGIFAASNTRRKVRCFPTRLSQLRRRAAKPTWQQASCEWAVARCRPRASFGGTPLLHRVLLHTQLFHIERTPQMSLAAWDCAAEHMGTLASRTSTYKCLQPLSLDSRVVHGLNYGISQAIAHAVFYRCVSFERAEQQPCIDSWSRSVCTLTTQRLLAHRAAKRDTFELAQGGASFTHVELV